MMMQQYDCCEKCKRQTNIAQLAIDQHVAYLCPTCHYIFSLEQNKERFKLFVCEQSEEQANDEMMIIHQTFSNLISLGGASLVVALLGLFIHAGYSVPQLHHLLNIFIH